MGKKTNIETGDPVVVVDAEGQPDLTVGEKGWANTVTYVDQWYVWFMPADGRMMYVLSSNRLEVDEEAKAAGLTLTENTIAKG